MSLIHGFNDALPDLPADVTAGKVLPSHWNAEHTFPSAGAGEVVFVDGSNHAATSADLTFVGGNLTVGAGGSVVTPSLVLGSIPAIDDTGASIATFLRGDGTWGTLSLVPGSITASATQVLIGDGAGNAAGSADLTFDDGTKTLNVGIGGFQAWASAIDPTFTDFSLILHGIGGVTVLEGGTAIGSVSQMTFGGFTSGTGLLMDDGNQFATLSVGSSGLALTPSGGTEPTGDIKVGFGSAYLSEITTPSSPSNGVCAIYCKDAGAGKTGLYVLFHTGVEQQIKVEA